MLRPLDWAAVAIAVQVRALQRPQPEIIEVKVPLMAQGRLERGRIGLGARDQLVNKGRAAVWRKLVEERKEATVSKSGKAKEDAEESESESDDGDDLLIDWRSKGI